MLSRVSDISAALNSMGLDVSLCRMLPCITSLWSDFSQSESSFYGQNRAEVLVGQSLFGYSETTGHTGASQLSDLYITALSQQHV